MTDNQKMQSVMFWLFISVFALSVLGTLGMVFFGFGTPTAEERSLLVKVFLGQTATSVFALFYSVNKLKKRGGEETIDVNTNTITYEAKDASEFYGRIAHKYDERNTNYLLQTHRSVTDALRPVVDRIPNAKILDLGGGTGRQITDHFHDKKGLSWTYVDNCPNMVTQFEKNLKGTALQREVLNEDVYNIHNKLRGQQFDAIIMSCLLTSLPNLPDFANLLPLLSPHGVIIIADIDPSYTALHPYYSIGVNGDSYALKTNPVNPLEICRLFSDIDMRIKAVKPVKKSDGIIYSYCLEFKAQG